MPQPCTRSPRRRRCRVVHLSRAELRTRQRSRLKCSVMHPDGRVRRSQTRSRRRPRSVVLISESARSPTTTSTLPPPGSVTWRSSPIARCERRSPITASSSRLWQSPGPALPPPLTHVGSHQTLQHLEIAPRWRLRSRDRRTPRSAWPSSSRDRRLAGARSATGGTSRTSAAGRRGRRSRCRRPCGAVLRGRGSGRPHSMIATRTGSRSRPFWVMRYS